LGLNGLRPDWRAKRFRISVRDTTPVNRPEIRAPGRAEAETGNAPLIEGDAGFDPGGGTRTAWVIEGVANGVAGADGEGEADSTTHIRWLLVATSLATVWARVE